MSNIPTNPEDLRFTKAPLSMDELNEHFTNRKLLFVFNYGEGELKGPVLLSYLANIGVNAEVSVSSDLPVDVRKALVRDYMNHRSVVPLNGLVTTVASVLLQAKGFKGFTENIVRPILNPEEVNEFIKENSDIVKRWIKFMDSMFSYCLSIHKIYVEAFGHPKDQLENIDDPFYVGVNFVHLFGISSFVEAYYSVPGPQAYFPKQFEDYMFAGKNLFVYFVKPENPLPALVEVLGSMTEGNMAQFQTELAELEAQSMQRTSP